MYQKNGSKMTFPKLPFGSYAYDIQKSNPKSKQKLAIYFHMMQTVEVNINYITRKNSKEQKEKGNYTTKSTDQAKSTMNTY